MPSSSIQIPDPKFSGYYYPEILEGLITYLRNNVPELTDEDPEEPAMQLLKAFAMVGHDCNVYLDHTGRERFLRTARMRESVRAHLELIGVELAQASPANADLVVELSKILVSTTTVIPAKSKFSTEATATEDAIVFEALTALATERTDEFTHILDYDASSGSWRSHTPGSSFTPWTGASPTAGDTIYFGHSSMLWDKISLDIATAATNISIAVWEYYDGDYNDDESDNVTNLGTTLRFELNNWLGDEERTGTQVRAKCNLTGGYEDLVVEFVGGKNRVTTTAGGGFLGQGSPSTDAGDYTVGSLWNEMSDLVDDTSMLTQSGENEVGFTLPQSLSQDWIEGEVGDTGSEVEAYWIRFRVIAASGLPRPVIDDAHPASGKQYLLSSITQGESQGDDPLGTSDGSASQEFQFAQYPVIDDDYLKVFVDDIEWEQVDNFINSLSTDRHYTVSFDGEGRAAITFGDGVNGMIPAGGVDGIRCEYRIVIADQSGNTGAETITINRGVSYANKVWNPRPATGYEAAEGSTEASLEQVKITGPASLRTRSRGVTPYDIEYLTGQFAAANGTRPFARALAIEEGLGVKTVECVVVGAGGVVPDQDYLDELDEYFNGDTETGVRGVLLMNCQLTGIAFVAHSVDVTATVYGGNQTAIETALTALLSPVALQSDEVTYVWDFGGDVHESQIVNAIMETLPAPRKCTLAGWSNFTLGAKELPTVGTLTITVED